MQPQHRQSQEGAHPVTHLHRGSLRDPENIRGGRGTGPCAPKKAFRLRITSLDLPFVGVIDLIADLDGKRTVVDSKTAASAYQEHEAILSDQLTAYYQLAERDAEQTAFCVLVKTKEAKIEWHAAKRSGDALAGFLAKAEYVGREIAAGRFCKRPGKWCSWCDHLPVCAKDEKPVGETLVIKAYSE